MDKIHLEKYFIQTKTVILRQIFIRLMGNQIASRDIIIKNCAKRHNYKYASRDIIVKTASRDIIIRNCICVNVGKEKLCLLIQFFIITIKNCIKRHNFYFPTLTQTCKCC